MEVWPPDALSGAIWEYGRCLRGVADDIHFVECLLPPCLRTQGVRKAHFHASRAINSFHEAMSGSDVVPHHLTRSFWPPPFIHAFAHRLLHGVCRVVWPISSCRLKNATAERVSGTKQLRQAMMRLTFCNTAFYADDDHFEYNILQ